MTKSDFEMLALIQSLGVKVQISKKELKLEGGVVDQKRFRDMLFIKCDLPHTLEEPTPKKNFWVLTLYPGQVPPPDAHWDDYASALGWALGAVMIVMGVVWHNIW